MNGEYDENNEREYERCNVCVKKIEKEWEREKMIGLKENERERERENDNKSMLNRSLPIYNFERHIFVIRHFSA